ncbi:MULTISPECIES: hypothetical protein [Acetobacteraceae]|uniref:hypothetical protein n=1 Tax=Acetobacteraceae TaxID=433 RepID=UPI001134443E|nr:MULTISPECIES: hypothetical protein [Acetobacteraceae]GCE89056.1 hypothetical protein MSKU15_0657 [Komagataeibacter diospyri]
MLCGTNYPDLEVGRVLWCLSVLAMIIFQGAALCTKGQSFDPVAFGTGVAALLAAGGFGVALKDRSTFRMSAEDETK